MRRHTLILVGFVILSIGIVGPGVAQEIGTTLAEEQSHTESVAETVRLSQNVVPVMGSGLLLGLGIGTIVGSSAMFVIWRRRLS